MYIQYISFYECVHICKNVLLCKRNGVCVFVLVRGLYMCGACTGKCVCVLVRGLYMCVACTGQCVCGTLFVCVCSVASLACVENPVMGQVCVCLCVFLSPCSE